ncbi:hypothetical protein HK096_010799 [Nowakowskiella sp. JEL0078]|nr:hypothetical protein HK096_010799 [Nowakowskiella sp. JEL0078]
MSRRPPFFSSNYKLLPSPLTESQGDLANNDLEVCDSTLKRNGKIGSLFELSLLRTSAQTSRRESMSSLISTTRGRQNRKTLIRQPQSRRSSVSSFQPSIFKGSRLFDEECAVTQDDKCKHPYDPSNLLREEKEIAILLRLARAMVLFGAPSYRVEARVLTAADHFRLPLSVLVLPNLLLVAFGDGSTKHPTRCNFLPLSQGLDIGKLGHVDKVAKKCLELIVPPHSNESFQDSVVEEFHESQLSLSPSSNVDPDIGHSTIKRNFLHETEQNEQITEMRGIPILQNTSLVNSPIKEEFTSNPQLSTLNTEPWYHSIIKLFKLFQTPVHETNRRPTSNPNYEKELELILHNLDKIVGDKQPTDDGKVMFLVTQILGSDIVKIVANGLHSCLLCIVVLNSNPADALVAFILGCGTQVLISAFEYFSVSGLTELVVAFAISYLTRWAQIGSYWSWMNSWWWSITSPYLVVSIWNDSERRIVSGLYGDLVDSFEWKDVNLIAPNLCHSMVAIISIAILLPGFAMTIGMLELGRGNSIAGSLRMLLACVRSIRLGFGLAMGSRFANYISPSVKEVANANMTTNEISASTDFGPNGWAEFLFTKFLVPGRENKTVLIGDYEDWTVCFSKVRGSKPKLHYWMQDSIRLPLFFPLVICILIILRAHPKQWFNMILDAGVFVSAFIIGVVANLIARVRNEIAIGSVLAGIIWLVPGSIGVTAAAQSIAKSTSTSTDATEASAGAATFGISMITRAMSIAVGLL